MQVNKRMKNRYNVAEKRWYVWVLTIAGIIGASLLIASFTHNKTQQHLSTDTPTPSPIQVKAILHYATSQDVPIQILSEITVTAEVLASMSRNRPCNFLVFGLGHDSLMWASLNPRCNVLFLEDNPKWVETIHKDAPELRAAIVRYRTQAREADELLAWYRSEQACSPATATLRPNERCRLALHDLPDEVYETEWDLVMIDAPKGYFPEAPGRMAPIFSAAVMARERKGQGVTHVFLHNVDRKMEKEYSEEFLCMKNLVNGAGRLWHFAIPPMANNTRHHARFC